MLFQKPHLKTILTIYLYAEVVIHRVFTPEDQIINAAYYRDVMERLWRRMEWGWPSAGWQIGSCCTTLHHCIMLWLWSSCMTLRHCITLCLWSRLWLTGRLLWYITHTVLLWHSPRCAPMT
jgi:hypothetical protein